MDIDTSATLTYLATPARGRVLAAKTVATALVGAGYGIAAGPVATAVGLAFGPGHSISAPDPLPFLAAAALVAAIAAAVSLLAERSIVRSDVS